MFLCSLLSVRGAIRAVEWRLIELRLVFRAAACRESARTRCRVGTWALRERLPPRTRTSQDSRFSVRVRAGREGAWRHRIGLILWVAIRRKMVSCTYFFPQCSPGRCCVPQTRVCLLVRCKPHGQGCRLAVGETPRMCTASEGAVPNSDGSSRARQFGPHNASGPRGA